MDGLIYNLRHTGWSRVDAGGAERVSAFTAPALLARDLECRGRPPVGIAGQESGRGACLSVFLCACVSVCGLQLLVRLLYSFEISSAYALNTSCRLICADKYINTQNGKKTGIKKKESIVGRAFC